MSTTARRIRATPARAASDAWQLIVDLLAPQDGAARRELIEIEGIASTVISTESPRDEPIVVQGAGPQVRIYCIYDEDSISGDGANESPLAVCPTAQDWAMNLPVDASDLAWITAALANKTTRVTARDKKLKPNQNAQKAQAKPSEQATVDMEAFLRP